LKHTLAFTAKLWVKSQDPRGWDWLKQVTVARSDLDNLPLNRLGSGERAVIAYARAHPTCAVALDDRQARLLAAQLGLLVVGTTGLLVQAKRAGLIPTLRPLLETVREQGFHLSPDVYDEALRLANEPTRDS
jgi:predicted nucleic acid-binding protein